MDERCDKITVKQICAIWERKKNCKMTNLDTAGRSCFPLLFPWGFDIFSLPIPSFSSTRMHFSPVSFLNGAAFLLRHLCVLILPLSFHSRLLGRSRMNFLQILIQESRIHILTQKLSLVLSVDEPFLVTLPTLLTFPMISNVFDFHQWSCSCIDVSQRKVSVLRFSYWFHCFPILLTVVMYPLPMSSGRKVSALRITYLTNAFQRFWPCRGGRVSFVGVILTEVSWLRFAYFSNTLQCTWLSPSEYAPFLSSSCFFRPANIIVM